AITTNPSKFEGPYDWTASSGGKLTDSCSWTSWPTNTADEKMTFCGDNVGEKVSVKNRDFTSCADSTIITDYCGNGYTYTAGGEECDDGNTSNSDKCTTSCDLTYCGDKVVQNPNGNGQKEECDDGNTTNNDGCDSTCKKEVTPTKCESLKFLNTEIIANTQTTLSVNVEPDSYVPDINWAATETGTFNDKNPYNSESETSVTFKNGSIDEYILAYDSNSPLKCNDILQVIGCKSLAVTPPLFDLTPGKTQTITITPNPTSWNKSFQWESTDTSATFNGQFSGYTSNDYTVEYTGNTAAFISITDIYGNCNASSQATTSVVTPICGDGHVDADEECDDGNTIDTDSCSNACKIPTVTPLCGNGIVETGEQCDDGNTVDTDNCRNNCTIPPTNPIVCTGITSNPTSLSAGLASDISITPQPANFTGTFIWTATQGLLQNLSNPESAPASTINTDENDVVHYDGNSASGDTISIREQSNQCAASMPITGPGGGGPSCGNGVIESGEQCEPPNTATCDANCQTITSGGGGPGGPGGTPCNIHLKNDKNEYLYDGTQYPADVTLSESPLRFYIEEISSGKPYDLKTVNMSGDFVGNFTSYIDTNWSTVGKTGENPMQQNYQTYYSFDLNPSYIDADTRLTVSSEFDSCSAQLKFSLEGPGGGTPGGEACTSMKASIDTINFGMINIENQLPIIVELITDPQNYSDTFTWTSTLPFTFNGFESGYSNGDKTVAIDLAPGKTIANVETGTISIKSTAQTSCNASIDVIPAVTGGEGIDSLVKKSTCLAHGTNIGQNGDTTTYDMFYYFEPEGRDATVIFKYTFGDNNGKISGEINGIPTASDHIKYTGMEGPMLKKESVDKIILACTAFSTSLCYEGDLDNASGFTLKNINDNSIDFKNDFIQITFTGIINAETDLTCDDAESSLELFRNHLKSQAYDASGIATSAHDSYASIWATCSSSLLTRNMGDVFFEEPFDWGVDTTTISGVKNSTGLVFKKYETSEPATSCQTGGANLIDRFSSYICEFSTFIDSLWEQEASVEDSIANRIENNMATITRYFEKSGSAANAETISSLNIAELKTSTIFSEKPDTTQNIYEYHGDLTLEKYEDIIIDDPSAKTILVYGNLIINSNIKYAATSETTLYKNIPSIAFVVRKDARADSGNIKIAPDVKHISGVFYAENSFESTGGNSNEMLTIQGSVYGDIEPLFKTRKSIGNPEKDEGSMVILYDERIMLNTPPGLKDILESNWEEVAR
ncbi:DUF4215 domain-containing protein, partial [Candidatus Peregrinibacteria bacterium]|nr:DUF4215 domain-containing protein [Candidatus Peregrinibacteria bacterium]